MLIDVNAFEYMHCQLLLYHFHLAPVQPLVIFVTSMKDLYITEKSYNYSKSANSYYGENTISINKAQETH